MSIVSSFRRMSTATQYFSQFPTYSQMVSEAKRLARRSVLVDHCGFENIDLKSEFKNVECIHYIEKESRRRISKLSLIEFHTEEDANSIVQNSRHNEGLLPIKLKFLQYCPLRRDHQDANPQELLHPVKISQVNELSSDFDDYVALLDNNMMSLVDLKLRFITLVNLEEILCSGPFKGYEIMPFGSSVIDTGTNSGDLDLIVTKKESPDHKSSRLIHLDKSLYKETRDISGFRGIMRWFDYILRDYMPIIDRYTVQSIHNAKVPIIRFNTRLTSFDCDLSFDLGLEHRDPSKTGIPMTESLYRFCRNSNIFGALVVYLRIFGKLTAITSKEPNIGMTNFQLLSLIIFYLQQITLIIDDTSLRVETLTDQSQVPILPSFRNLMKFGATNYNNQQLNQVLPPVIAGFFEFYSNFDFTNNMLNLFDSKIERKLDNSIMYVINPIDTSKNICHNVNRKGYENFIRQCRNANAIINGQMPECPLSMLRNLMTKNQNQSKKTRLINLEQSTLQRNTRQGFRANRIAEDVCK